MQFRMILLASTASVVTVSTAWAGCDSHLHQFIVGRTSYGVPSRDDFLDGLKDERKVILNQILSRPKQKMIYEYDFGDGWEHGDSVVQRKGWKDGRQFSQGGKKHRIEV